MLIYGVALLSACLLIGMVVGETIGLAIGVEANVGGVGIAMLLLVLASNSDKFRTLTEGKAGAGINFWSAMYIPIVVAMAAKQNVLAAISGGWMALIAGVLTVIISFMMIPVLYKLIKRN